MNKHRTKTASVVNIYIFFFFRGKATKVFPTRSQVLHSPDFNTLVAFEVPRLHAVRALRGRRPRYSLFGWWLRPGARAKGAKSAKSMARPAAKGRKAVKKLQVDGWG